MEVLEGAESQKLTIDTGSLFHASAIQSGKKLFLKVMGAVLVSDFVSMSASL